MFYHSEVRSEDLRSWVERERQEALGELDATAQRTHGQYFTPLAIADLMASMLPAREGPWRLLDPGAGIGVLSAAAVSRLASAAVPPSTIEVTAYEIDDRLVPRLERVLDHCARFAAARGVPMSYEVKNRDFLADAIDLAAGKNPRYHAAILNPPYGKIGTESQGREQARALGVEVPNLYAAFWSAAVRLTRKGGDVVSITPRSFCNGTYFKDFRRFLLASGAIRRLHVFDARDDAFSEQTVLQENLITHLAVKAKRQSVVVSAQVSVGSDIREREVPYERVVRPHDPDRFIHVVPDAEADVAAAFMSALESSLGDLGVEASTGPVVDFRATDLLRADAGADTVPLVYPSHLIQGRVAWSSTKSKRLNSIAADAAWARRLLVPDGHYVLVKRFTAKEERRRVVAALYAGDAASGGGIGIENHLNYLHASGQPLPRDIAVGLVVYLNSSHVDQYVRQFSGHTQINALPCASAARRNLSPR